MIAATATLARLYLAKTSKNNLERISAALRACALPPQKLVCSIAHTQRDATRAMFGRVPRRATRSPRSTNADLRHAGAITGSRVYIVAAQ